ncbi:hypothetical protein [Vibrio coralliilyticus]|uniref:hypothetical protein n=1 Tax=Vibrio coralliilyticus TaxID=190893 RepID=UPI0015601D47|nr:hypothetical protein [Vibrio coralliilyticus]NRF32748.1 hypothetical protein [Vibrio coralliilyticus]NRF54940.1 hypothetical protein [Vibrio coralliilyticus]NRG01961.1 hypothetical protein [Vibrio coralliilyticus]
MRPTAVRCTSHTNRAMRRRGGFVTTPAAQKLAPGMTLVEKTALMASSSAKVTKAA